MRTIMKSFLQTISILALLAITACGERKDDLHYTPLDSDVIQIEFDYPSNWHIINQPEDSFGQKSKVYQQLMILEPGSPATPSFGRGNWEISPYGAILIRGIVGESTDLMKQMNLEMDVALQNQQRHNPSIEFNQVRIHNNSSWKLEGSYLATVSEENISPQYVYIENIFFIVQDRYYSISFSIPDNRKSSDFFQDYHRMIKSINVLP